MANILTVLVFCLIVVDFSTEARKATTSTGAAFAYSTTKTPQQRSTTKFRSSSSSSSSSSSTLMASKKVKSLAVSSTNRTSVANSRTTPNNRLQSIYTTIEPIAFATTTQQQQSNDAKSAEILPRSLDSTEQKDATSQEQQERLAPMQQSNPYGRYNYSARWNREAPEKRWTKATFENFTTDEMLTFYDNATESDIKSILLWFYDRTSRPVFHDNMAVKVTVGFSLYNILDTNEKFHTISTLLSVRLRWKDHFLRWKSNRINSLYIPADRIWTPDIVFANSAEATNGYITTNTIVSSNGDVLWMFPILLKSQCIFQVFFFPFDCQKCKIVLISWTYSGRQVDLKPDPSDKNEIYYNPRNQEWFVDKINVSRNVVNYECCPNDTFPDVTFTIYLRRRSQFYVLNLIYPCLLFYILSFLGFLLPLESGDKVNMEVTVLLSLVVFMMFVNEMLPPTADMLPAIGMIVVTTMIEVVVALVMAVGVTYLAHCNVKPDKIPTVLQWLLEHYGAEPIVKKYKQAILHHRISQGQVQGQQQGLKNSVQKKPSPVFERSLMRRGNRTDDHLSTSTFLNQNSNNINASPAHASSSSSSSSSSDDEVGLGGKFGGMGDTKRRKYHKYWMEIARILDRICLVVFGILSGMVNLFLYLIMLADDTPFDVFTRNNDR